jgi:YggT family protein
LGALSILAVILYLALLLYFLALVARFLFDLVTSLSRGFRPRGGLLVFAEIVYTLTDPPLKALRRVIPPVRLGGVTLDFAWSILTLIVVVLMTIVSLGFAG